MSFSRMCGKELNNEMISSPFPGSRSECWLGRVVSLEQRYRISEIGGSEI